jgi:hypothetical protein
MGCSVKSPLYDDLVADQEWCATMPILLTPQMLNTMAPDDLGCFNGGFLSSQIRRYMLPVRQDRDTRWSSHPFAPRDSLHESTMAVVDGPVHHYPTKVGRTDAAARHEPHACAVRNAARRCDARKDRPQPTRTGLPSCTTRPAPTPTVSLRPTRRAWP